ncbi:SGNH/GDSL hydrolase family protein [Vibrio marisflavi]|uniref:SGNH hydrolase-type esterase domain-containing protein n=1 Tax=Vibrio marisflavi CECT 7928 TaxID=634439 RepID=A0ABM8ZZL3_9VIBR|nr:SGNH/GDSL hydrolase family protein [Vibrio marisflavi]CAH0536574.1 hypothetical protein VMF7928_00527 [Vibrio marisflavi CECT 7928]
MKSILCFGDSLTWGYNPSNSQRHAFDIRWPGAMQNALGHSYRVIEAGLNGRTTVHDDPYINDEAQNGAKVLPIYLESNLPLDLVIIMLGTNDLKARFGSSANEISQGVASLVRKTLSSGTGPSGKAPKVLLLSPPHIGRTEHFMDTIFDGQKQVSLELAKHYQVVAEFYQVDFLDTANFIEAAKGEGIHLDEEANLALAKILADKVQSILNGESS